MECNDSSEGGDNGTNDGADGWGCGEEQRCNSTGREGVITHGKQKRHDVSSEDIGNGEHK
jgi:hypothetical protein